MSNEYPAGQAGNVVPIAAYDAAEEAARVDLSHAEIMAFAPRTFAHIGFPDRAKVEREFARYADWVRDPGNQELFKPGQFIRGASVQTDLTADEAELVTWLCDNVVAFTRRCGRPVRPLCNPFAHLGLFRVANALREAYGLDQLSIFEVGPGTGYLGAMLAKLGYRYASMDNAQAFYLFQNRLLAETVGADFSDWGYPASPRFRKVTRVTHIPWWEYLRLGETCPFQADIVISNTNLGEMTRDALKFILRVSEKMLAKSKMGLFVFADIGLPAQNDSDTINGEFGNMGYQRVFERQFYAYAQKKKTPPALAAFLESRIPLYNPSRRLERKSAIDVAYLPNDQKPLDVGFTEVLEGWKPPVRSAP